MTHFSLLAQETRKKWSALLAVVVPWLEGHVHDLSTFIPEIKASCVSIHLRGVYRILLAYGNHLIVCEANLLCIKEDIYFLNHCTVFQHEIQCVKTPK